MDILEGGYICLFVAKLRKRKKIAGVQMNVISQSVSWESRLLAGK